jgi:hypothetical protein
MLKIVGYARKTYLNLAITLSTSLSGLAQLLVASTVFPHKLQVIPSLLRKGLCEAQVPLNSPFLRKISLTDIRTKKSARKPSVIKKVVIPD